MQGDWGIDDEMAAGGTPDDDLLCPICGMYMEWVDCQQSDCDDGYYHDCGEDCCCCAYPAPDTPCQECHGAGGWMECTALPHTDEQIAAYETRSSRP